ncbi:MAG: hypothetical protein ACLFP8_03250 [Alphaproteobacteria bacterium]
MFDEAYTKLELEEIATIIDVLNKKVEGSIFDPLETSILAIDLPFYEGYRFLSIADYATSPPLQRYSFQKNGTMELTLIDWNYKTIQEINNKAPIKLNEDNVIEYIRFYFKHVKGRHGLFVICETADHIQWKEEPPTAIKRSLNEALSPLQIEEKNQDGSYTVKAYMMLKDALFSVKVHVKPSGKINMSDQEIVMEDIPALDPTFMQ